MHSWQIIKVCSEWNTNLSGISFHNANTSLLAALWTEHRIWFFAHHQSSTALLRRLSNSHRSQWKRYNPVWLYWLFTLLSSQLFAENSSVSGMPAHSCRLCFADKKINKYALLKISCLMQIFFFKAIWMPHWYNTFNLMHLHISYICQRLLFTGCY